MQSWPTTLPGPTTNFNAKAVAGIIRTDMTEGRRFQRRRFEAQQRELRVMWNFTDLEFGLFQAFLLHKLKGGADAFAISMPAGGEGMMPVVAKFKDGSFESSHVNVLYWDVSATLVIEQPPIWSEDLYELLLLVGDYNDLEAAALALHILIHQSLPDIL